jgi:cold-inducible RNA-binding protein
MSAVTKLSEALEV